VSFIAITICIASQRVTPNVRVHFVIDSVRKLLDTPSYAWKTNKIPMPMYGNICAIGHQRPCLEKDSDSLMRELETDINILQPLQPAQSAGT